MVIDEVTIRLRAGKGGNGCSSFMSKKGMRIGFGGDGSRGASIIFKVSPHIYDLGKFRTKRIFSAKDGSHGLENNKSGKTPDDLILHVPAGTLIKDKDGDVIFDMSAFTPLEKVNAAGKISPEAVKEQNSLIGFTIARGGRAGKGNYKRKYATEGGPGEEKDIILDYRIPNDVAILGMPNSGKTSLFNALVGKHFKVDDYPFTTTFCMWAQFEFNFKVFTVLDMPALTDKSHKGKSLGSGFLKHLLRTRLILITADSTGDYRDNFSVIKHQIELFDTSFIDKKVFYLLTKADKIEKKDKIADSFSVSINNTVLLERLKELIFNELFYEENSNKNRK